MSAASQFGGGMPLGAVVQGIGLSEPQYVRADARTCSRAAYPRLSTKYPIGKLTGTIRTLLSVPANYCAAASPTYLVAGAAASAQALQYSSDGTTWSNASLVMSSGSVSCVIWAGTRFVAVYSNAQAPNVTTGDNPNSTWTATTGGFSSVPGNGQNTLAYSSTLGRVVSVQGTVTTSVQTLDNGSTTWVSRGSLPSATRRGVCWTGSRFLAQIDNAATISGSTDGITWTDSVLPEAPSSGLGGIASNGAGVVVLSGAPSGLYVSTDHGVTWAPAAIPGVVGSDAWRVTYSGDRFFVGTTAGVAMSLDGKDWFLESQAVQARVVASVLAKKGSAIVQVQGSTTAYSFSESATDFSVHNLQTYVPAVSGNPVAYAHSFIKAL